MLSMGMDVLDVIQATDLSAEEVRKLRDAVKPQEI